MSAIWTTSVPSRRSVGSALFVAGLCVVGLALVWVLAALVPITHLKDAVALNDFTRLDHPFIGVPAKALLDAFEPPFFLVWGAVLVVIALRRGLPRVATAIASVLVLAPLSAELLKRLLAHSHAHVGDTYIGAASWPSGHSTAVLALMWCAVLVAPPARRRPVAVVALALAAAVGVALLILAWHMPSDVLGGYLLATFWVALALASLRAIERRRPSSGPGWATAVNARR